METRTNDLPDMKAEALEACLSQIEGGTSLEETLLPYGSLAAELRPLLETALENRAYAASLAAPKGSLARSRARFLNAAQLNAERSQKRWFRGIAFSRLGFSAVAFLFVLAIVGLSSVAVSAKALPGDLLYPVKIASEQTRLLFAADPLDQLTLEKSFDERRAQEIVELLKQQRSEIVRLGGEVTRIQPEEWLVRNTRVLLDSNTQLEQEIEIGFYVEVTGLLGVDGSVLAQTIRARQITFSGTVDSVGSEQWVIDGLTVQVTGRTRWSGSPGLGSRVAVTAFVLPDGSLQASRIQTETATEAAVTWTSVPSVTPSPTSTPAPAPQLDQSSGVEDDHSGEGSDIGDGDRGGDEGGDDSGDDGSGDDGGDNSGDDDHFEDDSGSGDDGEDGSDDSDDEVDD